MLLGKKMIEQGCDNASFHILILSPPPPKIDRGVQWVRLPTVGKAYGTNLTAHIHPIF